MATVCANGNRLFFWAMLVPTKAIFSGCPLSNGQAAEMFVGMDLPRCHEPSRRCTSGKTRIVESSGVPFDKCFRRVDIALYDLRMCDAQGSSSRHVPPVRQSTSHLLRCFLSIEFFGIKLPPPSKHVFMSIIVHIGKNFQILSVASNAANIF